MKLHKGLNYDDIAYSDNGFYKLEIIGLKGEPGHDFGKDLDEIVRRVNAHDALVAACEASLDAIKPGYSSVKDRIQAALALAEKSGLQNPLAPES